jgi:tRNA 2-(methylsulfanyl)-N6-isopentenyladenosine37 hydroxylase
MLHLAAATDAGWFDRIHDHIDLLLIDHTHLEKRAASNAMNMVFRYSRFGTLVRALSEVVHEEMDHFVRMMDLLDARGVEFVKLDPAPYANVLLTSTRKAEPHQLLDRLLIASLIEARSCERFQILADNVDDPALRDLYADLYRDEARHHTLYTSLAREQFGHEETTKRLDELAQAEVEALRSSAGLPRLHSF